MSDLESIQLNPTPPVKPPRSGRRRLLWIGAGIAILLAAAIFGICFWASSAEFENLVRRNVVARLEAATGGRVEIASFHWHLFGLQAEAGGVVIHGLEAPRDEPYAKVERLRVQLSILGFWSPRILLHDLEVFRPYFHLIVFADGSTNQPHPRKPRKQSQPVMDTLLDLQAGHVAIEQGEIDYENRAASFDFQNRYKLLDLDASNASLSLAYIPAAGPNPESYHVQTAATHLNLFRGDARIAAQAAQGRFEATLDLVRNAAYLRSLRLSANGHALNVSGALVDFAHPRWQAKTTGELDMKLLDPVFGYPFAPQGLAMLDLTAAGQAGLFRIDGSVHIERGDYIGTGVIARGVGLDAHVHADPEQLLLTSIVARLRQGGQLEGEVALDHWLPPVPGGAVMQSAGARPNGAKLKTPHLPPPPTPIDIPVNGKVIAAFKNVSLDTLLDMVGSPPFQRLGVDALLNGPAVATWVDGDNRTLVVNSTLNLSPSAHLVAGEAPAIGQIDGTYTQLDGAVDLRKLELSLPASQIEAHGHLGAYPMTSPSSLAVDLHTQNLMEFDTVLRDLAFGHNGKAGAAALPVTLGGQADFHGTWTGSLVDPRLAGNAKATQLAIEIPSAAQGNNQPAPPKMIRWDTAEASGIYSAARISIDHSQFRHGQATIGIEGILVPTSVSVDRQGLPTASYDANSVLRLHLRAGKVAMDDLLPFTGQSLPVTGLLNAKVDADGPIHALSGTGWVELDGGSVFGEPVARIRAQGLVANQTIKLTSVTANEDTAKISATGSYELRSHRFLLDARAGGIDVSRLEWIRKQGLAVTGKLGFSLAGFGTFDDPRLEAHATLAGLALSGEPLGSLEFTAHTANRIATYDMSTRLEAAELNMHGQTALSGENTTQARLEFSRFNIGALLKMAHVQGLSGESALAGTVTVDGPLARPVEMRGEARLKELAVTLAGVHLHSEGGVHATIAAGRVNLDPLHVTGEETDLHVQGSLTFKEKKQLDLAASGAINLKIAETLDPDLTASGTSSFQIEAHGPLDHPELRGRIDFQNGSLALEDLPNGLSQLHGTLEFNQNRLEVKSFTAMTGGGLLSLGGYMAYQHGLYADLTATGNGIRIRYPPGVSSLADATMHLQGTQNNLLLSGNVLITRFTMSPDLDIAALATQANGVQTIAPFDAPSNHVRLDVHLVSSPQLNFQNAYAKLAGDVDLRLRGTLASPSLLGRVSITEGSALIAGTRYELQRGDISFTNPVRIQPSIDLNATARVEDYDITLGLHGTLEKPTITYRSDPPLPEADVVALLALGRTENQQRIYTQQQEQALSNPTTDALLGGALNATVSSRVQKLFGAGSVKVDPNYLGALGNSTSRIIVEEQLGSNVTLTYATNVNTTAQQLIQAEVAVNHHVSLLVARDESGVFSMVFKATRRYK